MSDDEPTDELATAFTDAFDVDDDTAEEAAQGAAEFCDSVEEELSVEDVVDAVEEAPYDEFRHAFNWAIGDFSQTVGDRPDTTSYRLEGFGPISGERAAE